MFMQPQCGAMLVTGDGEPGSTCLALFWTGGSQYCYKKKKKKTELQSVPCPGVTLYD